SGGILGVWDKSLFHKKRTYATEHCLCVEGTWIANNSDLLFILVYSPQELSLKRAMWTYMAGIINCWHGEVIIMGDFNEVRNASERYRSSFHSLNAAEFNMFIANSYLIDIPLGGYSFTWSDKPILLKEAHVDYGPTLFRLYHSWFLEDDFHSVIVDSWNNDGVFASNSMILLKNKLKYLKQSLKDWSSVKKRAIEGDENSKFFHGIVNKKRRHLAIKGIFPRRLDYEQSCDLEGVVSNEEIKSAIWDCGSDKSLGPDGFTFEFFKKYWFVVSGYVINAVKEFFNSSSFLKGCNSSFITLIPKARKEKCLLFKVNFQKAFDSVRWDHLDDILGKLKVNVHKISLYGVGVRNTDVHLMADSFGWLGNNLPFTYLGVKVGNNMTQVNSWIEVVKKVSNKLSFWRAKSLSVGGRLTLIKLVLGAIPTYYMSLFKVPEGILSHLEKLHNKFFLGADPDDRKIMWVSWKKVLAHKNQGGLGINSIYALNLVLMFRWIWRFLSSPSSLWTRVGKSIHGNSGGLENHTLYRVQNSTWSRIVKATNKLKDKGIDLMKFCKLVISNGNVTRFWHDRWCGDLCFKDRFYRLFKLELQKDVSVAIKLQAPTVTCSFRRPPLSGIELSQFFELVQLLTSVTLSSASDRWSWTLHGLGVFCVKSAKEKIDKHVLVVAPSHTRWSKVLPIKLNIFWWRMLLDRLPTRSNLYNRGIDIPCVMCPNCKPGIKSRNHLFFSCSMSLDLVRLFGRWWNIHVPSFGDPSSWDSWFKGLTLTSFQKRIIEASFVSMWWHI
nr:RNA-directed DNA polymerase, eukaryota, reverse transcriptase zinc-binding domain protein [Tanacetum cinerariifolium]